MLSKEKMAAYQKERRAKLKGLSPIVNDKDTGVDLLKCVGCASWEGVVDQRDLEIKKLQTKIALLELQIKKGVAKSEPLPIGDSAADLFARNVAAKNARFQKIGMMAHD
jgi:hypothetical protein